MHQYKRLEEYGIIGNLHVCALAARDGSIDWCCFPHLDSPSVFAAILDPEKGGHFSLRPRGNFESKQSYLGSTNILVTAFDTSSGSALLTEFMPVAEQGDEASTSSNQVILRKVQCMHGRVEMELEFKPRFDYGRITPECGAVEGGALAVWGEQELFLQTSTKLEIADGGAKGTLELGPGETQWVVLEYGSRKGRSAEECEALLDRTRQYWLRWIHKPQLTRPVFEGPWHDLVVRSALVLKLLTNSRTGAIAAAPTTSLPESIGGVRNWDYRYAWLRDSSFTVQALDSLGHVDEVKRFFQWFKGVISKPGGRHKKPDKIKIGYTVRGEEAPEEKDLHHLAGYRNSSPVRISNGAFQQTQMDVYGDIISTFYETRHHAESVVRKDWDFIQAVAEHVRKTWDRKDSGMWEFRGIEEHFTHSKLMCWVALDRSIKMAKEFHLECPFEEWTKARDTIHRTILDKGFNHKLNSFTQAFETDYLDASNLMIPVMGLLPGDDPRTLGTIQAVIERLSDGVLVCRYKRDDNLPGEEGAFTACSFWLVKALALSGQIDKAEEVFSKVLKFQSPLGLFSEEIDPRTHLQIGNFPQAFSHIYLINAALYLGRAQGREGPHPKLMGD